VWLLLHLGILAQQPRKLLWAICDTVLIFGWALLPTLAGAELFLLVVPHDRLELLHLQPGGERPEGRVA
jgi:hypothetical protein